MVAGDLLRSSSQPWLHSDGRAALRIITPLPVLAVVWWIYSLRLGYSVWLSLLCYAIINLMLIGLMRREWFQQHSRDRLYLLRTLAWSDGLVALFLLVQAGPVSGVVPVIFFLFTLKVLCYQRSFQWMMLVPTLLGPCYLAALTFAPASGQPHSSITWSSFATLLVGSAAYSTIMLGTAIRRQREQKRALQQFGVERTTYEARITELNSVTNDLRARIRSQQALEESLRVITGSLSLDDVLQQILDSATQMLGPECVDGAALTLCAGETFTNHLLVLDSTLSENWAQPLAQHVLHSRGALLVADVSSEANWQSLHAGGVGSAMSMPLAAEDGEVIGALSVVSRQVQAFSSAEARYLNAFGIQACVAIRNAELHSQLRSQWSLLEAVLRDLGDGLVVYDSHGKTALANPVAQRILAVDDEAATGIQDQIDKLVSDVQQGSRQMLLCEIQNGSNQDEHVYQAFASQARVGEGTGHHVAVILHDVTSRKVEERARTEFISMVSHELRNPLHTLSGFLKVVIQGRAGVLTPLQHDFLQTAEEQVDKLNGRINELLEFNRINAGRLHLQCEWSHIPSLAQSTTSALMLQAEQAGLELINRIPDYLPDVLMDSKRIGQVLTNLVENAIKATPMGSITLQAEVNDNFVRVSVSDTGVGIAATDARKIFDPFYSTGTRSNMYGAHLGLGLSICQQIIQGHGGRIWVESEEGRGSTFIFTLPLIAREQEALLSAA